MTTQPTSGAQSEHPSTPAPLSFSSLELAQEALRRLQQKRGEGAVNYVYAYIDHVPDDAVVSVYAVALDVQEQVCDICMEADTSVYFALVASDLCWDGPQFTIFSDILQRLERLEALAKEMQETRVAMLPGFWALADEAPQEPLEIGFTGKSAKTVRIDFAIALAQALSSPIEARIFDWGYPIEVTPEDTRNTVLDKCPPEPEEPAPVRAAIIFAWLKELRALADNLESVGPDDPLPEGVAIEQYTSDEVSYGNLTFHAGRLGVRYDYLQLPAKEDDE